MKRTPINLRPRAAVTKTTDRAARSKFYQSKEWRAFRKIRLERVTLEDFREITAAAHIWPAADLNRFLSARLPYCVICRRQHNRLTPARVLDHVLPINQGGAKLSRDNVQFLCDRCHAIKSGKEAHE